MRQLIVEVDGTPRPQGSLRVHRAPGGKIAARYSQAVYAWRAQVTQALLDAANGQALFAGPVSLRLGFKLRRPQDHFGTGRNANTLRPGAPGWPTGRPDLDKLARSIADSITDAGIWKDDSQVVHLETAKRYTDNRPGVVIHIEEMERKLDV